jgi:hypothetical protein
MSEVIIKVSLDHALPRILSNRARAEHPQQSESSLNSDNDFPHHTVYCVCVYYCRTITAAVPVCVCLLMQDLLQSCAHGGRIVEDMCYEIRRAEACVD